LLSITLSNGIALPQANIIHNLKVRECYTNHCKEALNITLPLFNLSSGKYLKNLKEPLNSNLYRDKEAKCVSGRHNSVSFTWYQIILWWNNLVKKINLLHFLLIHFTVKKIKLVDFWCFLQQQVIVSTDSRIIWVSKKVFLYTSR
jgi:hypothetical protein